MSQEMVASAPSAASRIAVASASALPANMVAEMTRKVVSVMSRSIGRDRAGRARAPARDLLLGRGRHGRHQAREVGGTEQRRGGAALPAPAGAFGGEDAVAQRVMEHPLLQRRLGELGARLQQHLLDQRRRRDIGDDAAPVVEFHDRLFEHRPRQAGERVAHEGKQEPPRRQRPGRRLHGRGIERSIRLRCKDGSHGATPAARPSPASKRGCSPAPFKTGDRATISGRNCLATAARTPTGTPSSNWRAGSGAWASG